MPLLSVVVSAIILPLVSNKVTGTFAMPPSPASCVPFPLSSWKTLPLIPAVTIEPNGPKPKSAVVTSSFSPKLIS